MFNLDAEWWEKEFFNKYEVTKRGVHPSSIKKLRREGILIGRDLRDSTGHIYWTVYLVSENKEFLNKFPKKK